MQYCPDFHFLVSQKNLLLAGRVPICLDTSSLYVKSAGKTGNLAVTLIQGVAAKIIKSLFLLHRLPMLTDLVLMKYLGDVM